MVRATVKTHVGNVFGKLEVTNRVQVARLVHDATGAAPALGPGLRPDRGPRS